MKMKHSSNAFNKATISTAFTTIYFLKGKYKVQRILSLNSTCVCEKNYQKYLIIKLKYLDLSISWSSFGVVKQFCWGIELDSLT